MKHISAFTLSAAVLLGAAAIPAAYAGTGEDAPGMTFSAGAGMAVMPAYEGSSAYRGLLLPRLSMAAAGEAGRLSLGFPDGLRWDLPVGDTVGLALLGNYDPGRRERVRTLSGGEHHLRGMGDLGGTPVAGLEASLNAFPYRLFVRGMQALRSRSYGGEGLGYTRWLDAGLGSSLPLGGGVAMDLETFVTWSDHNDMMARFGVTPEQAARSQYGVHRPGGGLRGATMQWGLNWQWTPQVTLDGGVRLSTLSSAAARNSPLTQKTTAAGLFLDAMYTF